MNLHREFKYLTYSMYAEHITHISRYITPLNPLNQIIEILGEREVLSREGSLVLCVARSSEIRRKHKSSNLCKLATING